MLSNIVNNLSKRQKEIILVVLVLLISGIAHGFNMFRFPYYESDEGTYLSQAWSLISAGKLAPYTYWYDHAPGGWIFIAEWLQITKLVFTFGFSVNSGRVFMLIIHLLSTYLVMRIAQKLTNHIFPAIVAGLIFSLSPLGVYFQRRLLLDNIMMFWVLCSYQMILGPVRRLSHFVMSALFMGIAVLSKENAIFFIPGIMYTMFRTANENNKRFAITSWLVVFSSVIFLYIIFAFLKGELFPYGSLLGGDSPHVSLLETLKYQGSRSGGSILNFKDSSFWENMLLWLKQDVFIITLGIVSNLILLVISIIRKKYLYLGLCLIALFFWGFLMRGGIVIEFYVIPLIPIFSLLIGITLFELIKVNNSSLIITSLLIMIIYTAYGPVSQLVGQNAKGYYLSPSNQTRGQIEAVNWIREHVRSDAVVVIDNYSYLDFQSEDNPSGKVFPNAHYYWKIDQDSEIKDALLKNNPESIDYIAKTPQMATDLLKNISPLTTQALTNSVFAKGFNSDGWGVEIWATRYPSKILGRSWETYKQQFVRDGNHSIDPNQNDITTSEGQSYILLRAVWMDDKETFAKTWDWTKQNLMNQNGVFSWKWGKDDANRERVLDDGSATDADTDIALALLFASKKWNEPMYLDAAKTLLDSIWATEVRLFNGKYYILPGNWAMGNGALTVNPSYLSPYAYRIFAEVGSTYPWMSLVDTSYEVLKGCMTYPLFPGDKPVNLPPNWCEIGTNGEFRGAKEPGLESTDYSYDALRTMWRLALDYRWYAEPKALELLKLSSVYLLEKWNTDGKIIVGYTHDGRPWEEYESVLGYSMNVANFSITSPEVADDIYNKKILGKFYEDFEWGFSYWEDPKNYYVQNWAWFGTALYSNNLPNLWNGQ